MVTLNFIVWTGAEQPDLSLKMPILTLLPSPYSTHSPWLLRLAKLIAKRLRKFAFLTYSREVRTGKPYKESRNDHGSYSTVVRNHYSDVCHESLYHPPNLDDNFSSTGCKIEKCPRPRNLLRSPSPYVNEIHGIVGCIQMYNQSPCKVLADR